MSSCLEHSKETHQIPLKDLAEATDNYKRIYHELKSFLSTTRNESNYPSNNDEIARRRYLRLMQPCIFIPSLEYAQTYQLINWLQEKAEGKLIKLKKTSYSFCLYRNKTNQ